MFAFSVLFINNYLLLLEVRKPGTIVKSRQFPHQLQLCVKTVTRR